MKYMGSKNRIAKEIIEIMSWVRKPGQYWVEPFVGGGNIIDKVENPRIGSDANIYTIQALRAIRDYLEDLPRNNKEFTEKNYRNLRRDDSYPFKGYAGFAFSFGGKWLGGWCRDKECKRDYIAESFRNAVKQSSNLQGVKLLHKQYDKLNIPPDSLIYCDPPYENTTKYNTYFNHRKFWKWCRQKVNEGHTVFVSEYKAPSFCECIWSKKIVSSLTKDTGSKKGVEKLFLVLG